ncbi:MAG: hypothetical protein WCG80_03145 [Spirochaetales bacterium]
MNSFWEANLAALALRQEALSNGLWTRLRALGPWKGESPRSRAGQELPSVLANGRRLALESAYDAQKEAERWSSDLEPDTTLVVFGGAPPTLWKQASKGRALIVAVEPRLEVWQNLFTLCDFGAQLADPLWFATCEAPGRWLDWLASRYHPLWDGGVVIRWWRPATSGDDTRWEAHASEAQRRLASWSGDFSTQARFGARWYHNLLFNLRTLEPLKPGRVLDQFQERPAGAVIAGAGPGLEVSLALDANRRLLEGRPTNGWKLLATDTALPALLARGWRPDVVLCLDGQLPSAHHFHPPLPDGLPLLTDVASLPLFHRLGLTVLPFLSGHPMARVVQRHFSGLPRIEVPTANVSGLGLELAAAWGAQETRLWGVNLAYPWAKGYARGTYVYPLHLRAALRTSPGETRLLAGCYGAEDLQRHENTEGVCYTTPLLREYRVRMDQRRLELASKPAVPFVPYSKAGNLEAWEADWRRRLQTLPKLPAGQPMAVWLASLPTDRQEDWLALWPLALAQLRLWGRKEGWHERLVEQALAPLQD